MVLAKVNKELVTLVESLGVQAVGISGKDGGLLQCHKKLSNGEDIGYVGDIEKSKSEGSAGSSGKRFPSDRISDWL